MTACYHLPSLRCPNCRPSETVVVIERRPCQGACFCSGTCMRPQFYADATPRFWSAA